MQILCMRHGHADSAAPGQSDAERPLSPRGREQVREVARALVSAGVRPTRVLTSPLTRTVETAQLVAEQLGLDVPLEHAPELAYTAPAAAATGRLEQLEDGCALAVGHMPTLPETIYLLTGEQLGGLTTAQIVCVETGRVHWTLTPGDTAPRKR